MGYTPAIENVRDRVRFAATVADATASTFAKRDGDTVLTQGYTTSSDGGHSDRIYRSTGRSALPAAQLNGVCIAGPGADDYFELKNKYVLNVREFGAHPDNTPAENYTAFQQAIDAALNTYFAVDVDGYDGPIIYIPNGIYEISQTLEIDMTAGRVRLNIHGQDMFGTTIRKADSFTGSALIEATNVNPLASGTYPQFWHWSNLQLLGQASDTSKVDNILVLPALVNSHFRNIYCNVCNYNGFKIGVSYINQFDHCYSYSAGLNAWFQYDGNCNACVWNGCVFAGSGVGLHFQGGIQNSILGCTIESNNVAGIYLDRSSGFVIQSYFEANGETGMVIRTVDGNPLLPLVTCSADAGTDEITAVAHGLTNGKPVSFSSTGTLPSPLVADTDYYVTDATDDTFKLSTTYLLSKVGTAIDITTAGTGTHSFSKNWRVNANIIMNGSAYTSSLGELPTNMSAAFPTSSGTIQGCHASTDQAPKAHVAFLAARNITVQQPSVPTVAAKTKGSITSGTKTLTVTSTVGFIRYRYYRIAGAGFNGADHYGMADSIDSATQITMRDNAQTTVSDVDVELIPDSLATFHGGHVGANGITLVGATGYARIEVELPTRNNSYGMTDIHDSNFSFAPKTVLRLKPELCAKLYLLDTTTFAPTGLYYADRPEWALDRVAGEVGSDAYAIHFTPNEYAGLAGKQCVAEIAWLCLDREGDSVGFEHTLLKLYVVSDLGAGTASTNNFGPFAPTTVKSTCTTTSGSKVVTVTKYEEDFREGRYVVIRCGGAANSAATAFTADAGTDVITSAGHGLANEDTILLTGSDLPEGLLEDTIYFVRDATTDTLKVELSIGGGAVDILDAGSGPMTWATHDIFYGRIVSISGSDLTLDKTVPTTLATAAPITSPDITYVRMTFEFPEDNTDQYIGFNRVGGSPGSRAIILDAQIKAVGNPVDVMQLEPPAIDELTIVSKPYRAVGDGVTDCRSIFLTADADYAAYYPGKNIVVPEGTYYFSATSALTLTYEFRKDAIIKPSAAANVTVPNFIADDDQQIFDVKITGGSVTVTDRNYVTPKHYGALADGATNDYIPIAYAYQLSTGAKLRWTSGTYVCDGNVDITSECIFEDGAVLQPASGRTITIHKYSYEGDYPFDTSAGGSFVFANNADGNLGASHTFTCDEGGDSLKTGTLTADVALTLAASSPGWYSIILTQDGTGGWDVTSYVTTIIGTAPTINAAPGDKTILALRYDGTNWFWI